MQIPLQLGADDGEADAISSAIMRPLEDVLDSDDDSHLAAEVYGEQALVLSVWACNERLAGALVPSRMLETLPDWEESCGLRPSPSDSDSTRRAAVAATLRGLAGNALADIAAAAAAAMGENFEDIVLRDPADDVTYWPGINPGPPGFEWSSNRAVVGIRVNANGLTDAVFRQRVASLWRALDALLPSWQCFSVGQGSRFTVGTSVVGDAFI